MFELACNFGGLVAAKAGVGAVMMLELGVDAAFLYSTVRRKVSKLSDCFRFEIFRCASRFWVYWDA